MNTLFTGRHIIRLDSVDSTNNYAAKLVRETNWTDGTVILAEEQTAGKGRNGKQWQSARGSSLTCTYVFKSIQLDLPYLFMINMVAGIAVFETVSRFIKNDKIKVKWPNDIYVGNKKIAGILTETQIRGSKLNVAIIGIGLNLDFSDRSLLQATSLLQEGVEVDKDEVLKALSEELERSIFELHRDQGALLHRYNSALFLKDSISNYQLEDGTSVHAKLLHVSMDGAANFEIDGKERPFYMDEISWIGS